MKQTAHQSFIQRILLGILFIGLLNCTHASSTSYSAITVKVTVNYTLSKPFNQAQTATLCSNLYSHISGSALYNLSSTQGVPFTCTLTDENNLQMVFYVNQESVNS